MSKVLIGWPIYSDVGQLYSPTVGNKKSWPSSGDVALANVQDGDLSLVARTHGILLSDTRLRNDLLADAPVRGVAIPKHNLSRTAKWRVLGRPASMLCDYEAGDDIESLSGTFARAPTATVRAATYIDASGVLRIAGENRCLRSQEFDNASWTKSSITVAADSIAAPDTTTTADTLTASGANGTAKQAVTTTAVAWVYSVWLKRKTGTGNVDITMDGTTWVTKTLTTNWQRFSVSQTGVAGTSNPGIRLVTSGDAVYAWGAQVEIGSTATSYLSTTSAMVAAPRDGHFTSIAGYRSLLFEGVARTNICLQSENFGTTWGTGGTTPTRSAAAHIASGVTLDLLGDDDVAVAEFYSQVITFTGNAAKVVEVFWKAGTLVAAAGSRIQLQSATGPTDKLFAVITSSGGVPTVTMTTGTYLGFQLLADGVYRLLFVTASVTAAETNTLFFFPATTAAQTGNVYFGGVQVENALFPSSYIPTTTATVQRAADTLTFPYSATPQEATAYLDAEIFVTADAATNFVGWSITDAAGAAPYWMSRVEGGSLLAHVQHDNGTGNVTSDAGAISWGQRLEHRSVLASTGAVTSASSVNAGAETVGATSGTKTLAGAWAASTIYVGSSGVGGQPTFMAIRSLRIVAGTQTLAAMRTVVTDSGWLAALPADISGIETRIQYELDAAINFPLAYLMSSAFTGRYWSVQVSDEANVAGYIETARLVVFGAFQPSINFIENAGIGVKDGAKVLEMESGAVRVTQRAKKRRVSIATDEGPDSQSIVQLQMDLIIGLAGQFWFAWADDDSYPSHRSFLGRFTELSQQQVDQTNRWGKGYSIEEVV